MSTIKIEPRLDAPETSRPSPNRRVVARGPWAAAALTLAGFPVLGVEAQGGGHASYIFAPEARHVLQTFLAAFSEMRALAQRADDQRRAYQRGTERTSHVSADQH